MNILKQVEELQKKIDELKAQCEKSEPMFELPATGSRCHFVSGVFDVCLLGHLNNDGLCDVLSSVNNLFTDKAQAEVCAKHLRDTFWFTRKAIEFAEGHEFVVGADSYFAAYDHGSSSWVVCSSDFQFQSDTVYMAGGSVSKFCEWLNKHKPNGWK